MGICFAWPVVTGPCLYTFIYLYSQGCSDRPIFIYIYISVFPGLCSLAGLGLDPAVGPWDLHFKLC